LISKLGMCFFTSSSSEMSPASRAFIMSSMVNTYKTAVPFG
jgi:hypothetical protein